MAQGPKGRRDIAKGNALVRQPTQKTRALKGRQNLVDAPVPRQCPRPRGLQHIERRPLLTADARPALFEYTGGILRNLNAQPVQIGGVEDHIHVLFRLSRTVALAKTIENLKTGTSKWIKTKGPAFHDFAWQAGYGAFSVSPDDEEAASRYIRGQEEHHRRVSFQDELRELLSMAGMEFDERYLWE